MDCGNYSLWESYDSFIELLASLKNLELNELEINGFVNFAYYSGINSLDSINELLELP